MIGLREILFFVCVLFQGSFFFFPGERAAADFQFLQSAEIRLRNPAGDLRSAEWVSGEASFPKRFSRRRRLPR